MLIWDGAVVRTVTVTVTEGEDSSPVAGATAILMRSGPASVFSSLTEQERLAWLLDLTHEGMAGTTAADGSVTLCSHFPAGGHRFLFRRTGTYGIAGVLIIVNKGAVRYSKPIEHLMQVKERSLNEELPPISVSLP